MDAELDPDAGDEERGGGLGLSGGDQDACDLRPVAVDAMSL